MNTNKTKILLLIFSILLFSSFVSSTSSRLIITLENNQLVASTVYDNDDSIEKADIFITESGATQQHAFTNITQGQIFDLPFTNSSTISYNFTDTDGEEIGLGIMLIVQQGSTDPPCTGSDCTPVFEPILLNYIKVTPRLAEGNSAYYIDVIADVNKDHPITEVKLHYGIYSEIPTAWVPAPLSIEMISNGEDYVTTIGPFSQALYIPLSVYASDNAGITNRKTARGWFEILLPEENSCTIGQVIIATTKQQIIAPTDKVSFADLSGFSYLSVSKDAEGKLKTVTVIDNDNSIGRVDVFYKIGDSVTQNTYQNVIAGQSLGKIPVENDFEWFNYYDSDGQISNISTLNPFIVADAPPIVPPPGKETGDYVSKTEIVAEKSLDGKSFEVSIIAYKSEDVPDSIIFQYKINDGQTRKTALIDNGETYSASLGSFDGEISVGGNVVASSEEKSIRWYGTVKSWFALILPGQLECTELCFDGIDNDNDGLVDEDCVMLSELFFLKKNVPYYSLSNEPIKGDLTIKNSGVINATASTMNVYFNDELITTVPVQPIAIGATEKVFFEIPYKEEYEGKNSFRGTLDAENTVAEMIETNNEYKQEIIIGPEFFNVLLNYNDTPFPADYRQIKVMDSYERPVKNATLTISSPSSKIFNLTTNSEGIAEFQMPETGTYAVAISKEEFIPFTGKFAIAPLVLVGLKEFLPVGETQKISVENKEHKKMKNGLFEISLPQGTTTKFDLQLTSLVSFTTKQQGKYGLRIVRNELVVYESDFLATGMIESVLLGPGSILDLLFGSIIRTPILFLFLIILCALSAYFAYNKTPLFFREVAKGSTEKKIEQTIRIGVAIVYFVVPFQFERLFGFNAGLMAIFLELIIFIIYEYYLKKIKKTRKAIKV